MLFQAKINLSYYVLLAIYTQIKKNTRYISLHNNDLLTESAMSCKYYQKHCKQIQNVCIRVKTKIVIWDLNTQYYTSVSFFLLNIYLEQLWMIKIMFFVILMMRFLLSSFVMIYSISHCKTSLRKLFNPITGCIKRIGTYWKL